MANEINIILAVPSEFSSGASLRLAESGVQHVLPAHMIYGIGRGFHLYRSRRHLNVSGGYMVLDTSGFKGGGPVSSLVNDILDECQKCGFVGIVIDTGGKGGAPVQISLAKALAHAVSGAENLSLFVPEALSDSGETSIVRISTALSGGTLRRHLSDAADKYGCRRLSLEIERVCMDFALPAKEGIGKPLSPGELHVLMEQYNGKPCFSSDLATNYFHYRDKSTVHFVLYDDHLSIRRKLALAEDMGIEYAFLYYPHIESIFSEITTKQRGL